MVKTKLAFLLLALLVISCNSSKSVVRTTTSSKVVTKKPQSKTQPNPVKSKTSSTNSSTTNSNTEVNLEATSNIKTYADEVKAYVDNFKDIAMNNMKNHGIPASIILAQGILESGAGKGKLALAANNHFGIKCHTGWTGESVKHDDDAAQECFRIAITPCF